MHVSRGGGVLTAIRTLLFHEPGSGFNEGQDELAVWTCIDLAIDPV